MLVGGGGKLDSIVVESASTQISMWLKMALKDTQSPVSSLCLAHRGRFGTKSSFSFTCKYDGKECPVTGGAFDSISFKRVDSNIGLLTMFCFLCGFRSRPARNRRHFRNTSRRAS